MTNILTRQAHAGLLAPRERAVRPGLVLAILVILFTSAVGTNWIGSVGFLGNTNASLLNLPGGVPPSFNFIVSILTGNLIVPILIYQHQQAREIERGR